MCISGTVCTPAAERQEAKRYKRYLGEAEKHGVRNGLALGAVIGFFFFCIMAMYGVGMWFGVWEIIRSRCVPFAVILWVIRTTWKIRMKLVIVPSAFVVYCVTI